MKYKPFVATAVAVMAFGVVAAPSEAAKKASTKQVRTITKAVQKSPVGGLRGVPRNRYKVTGVKVSTVSKSWATASVTPTKAFQDKIQGVTMMLIQPAGTSSWVVVDLGSAQVGCGLAPDKVIDDLLGAKSSSECDADSEDPSQDATKLLQTAQSQPVAVQGGKVASVVGQAAITGDGHLVVRLAGPNAAGVAGTEVLVQTSTKIGDAVSAPTKAKVAIVLKADGTGTATVTGPKNATQPDAVDYKLSWSAGSKPSIKITGAGV